MTRAALRLAVWLCALPLAAGAQDFADSDAAVLRWLDRLTGETADIEMVLGQEAESGRLRIRLDACRYPADNPASDAEAHLTITEAGIAKPVFDGWMVASSPALSALDHPRYDVWVLRCDIPDLPPPVVEDPLPEDGVPVEEGGDPATSDGAGQ